MTSTELPPSLGGGALQVVLPDPWLHIDLAAGGDVEVIAELARRLGGCPGDWTPTHRKAIADAMTAAATAGTVCLLVRPSSDPGWPVPLVGCLRLLPWIAATPEQVARWASDVAEAPSAIGDVDGLPIVATVCRQYCSLEVRYVVLCPTVTVTVELWASLTVDVRRIVGEAAELIRSIEVY